VVTPPSAWRPNLGTWLGLAGAGFALWLVIHEADLIFDVAAVLLTGYLLCLVIAPLADLLEKRRIPRAVAVLVFYALSFCALVLLAHLLLPVLQVETRHIRRTLPEVLSRGLAALRAVPVIGDLLPPNAGLLPQSVGQAVQGMLGPALVALLNVGELVVDLAVVLVLAFFFAVDPSIGRQLIVTWLPQAQRHRAWRVARALQSRLTRWLWAQVAMMLFFAVTFSSFLFLLRVPFAFSIGVIGGLLDFIPYVGGLVALVLALISALAVQPILAVYIALLYIVLAAIQGHVLAPALYGRVTNLHPALVLLALLIGAKAAQLTGTLLAIPVAVVVTTLIEEAQGRLAEPAAASGTSIHVELERT